MSFRDLVSADACAPDDGGGGSSSAAVRNPITQFVTQFIHSQRTQEHIDEVDLSGVNLSADEQKRLRTRANVLARQFYPDQSEDFISSQVESVLRSFHVSEGEGSGSGSAAAASDQARFARGGALDDVLEDGSLGDLNEWMANNLLSGDVEGAEGLLGPQEYEFAERNKYASHPAPMDAGIELFQHGSLSDAVLAFESEVQREGSANASDAWRFLGACHAENDNDTAAILALERAVEADPHHLEALLELGVCHTNELQQHHALSYLQRWLTEHPQYAGVIDQARAEESTEDDAYTAMYTLSSRVLRYFRKAAELNPRDAEVHTVLGVMYNLSREYDAGVRHFQRALELTPTDYSLWNKLGATQANQGKPKEAVHAYQRALELKPQYVRAWTNLGIAYSNMDDHARSAKYFLKALQLNDAPAHIWNYLSMAFMGMKREDLLDKVANRRVADFRELM